MAATKTAGLWANLKDFIDREQFAKAVKCSSKILSSDPANVDALRCKCVALLNLNKFSAVLPLTADKPEVLFERAYALYRLGRLEDARDQLVSDAARASADPRLGQLHGQVLYKLGSFGDAAEVYGGMYKEDPESSELATNLSAALVSAGAVDDVLGRADLKPDLHPDSFEIRYNLACANLASGKLSEAIGLISQAQDLCAVVLAEEGLSEVDIMKETAVLRKQQAYALKQFRERADAGLVAPSAGASAGAGAGAGASSGASAGAGAAAGAAAGSLDDELGTTVVLRKRRFKSDAAKAKRRTKLREAHVAKLMANSVTGYLPPPDPERWVPRSQRAAARRRRRRAGQNVGGGAHQGGRVKEADLEKLDAHARVQKKAAAAASSDAAAPSTAASTTSNKKKKKKKGRR